MEIHQILTALSYGDAVSNDAINIKKNLNKCGFKSEIYSKYCDPRVSMFAKKLDDYKGDNENILIYHYAFYGGDVTEFTKKIPGKKILIYHNITPPYFFRSYDEELAMNCAKGLEEIKNLSSYFQLGVGDSEFNRKVLENLGFDKTDVLPIFMDFENRNSLIEEKVDIEEKKTVNFLFVGRISPNKKQEDIIKVFYCYHKYINRNSILHLVGNLQINSYVSKLKSLVENLGLTRSVMFPGLVSQEELEKYYRKSDIFICMSEHEGFCVPILEAMYFGLPVIAYDSTAIPYTMGNSGILVKKKSFMEIAELVNVILNDDLLKNTIIFNQKSRVKEFGSEHTLAKLLNIIESFVNDFKIPQKR